MTSRLAQTCTGKYYTIEAIDNQQFSIKFDENPYQTDLNLCGKYVICSIIAELKNIKLVEIRLGEGVHTVKYAKLNDLQQKIMDLFHLNPDDMIAMMNGK